MDQSDDKYEILSINIKAEAHLAERFIYAYDDNIKVNVNKTLYWVWTGFIWLITGTSVRHL